jgi:hypothetical protein
MIDLREFQEKLRLHPSAVLMTGQLTERPKKGFMGSQPHYLTEGTPRVQWNDETGEPLSIEPFAIQAEAKFTESNRPLDVAYAGQTASILFQLTLEGRGGAPPVHLVKVAKEFGKACQQVSTAKTQVIIAAIPVFTAAKMGMSSGKLYPLGIFTVDGHAIWINPEALASKVLKAEFPESQKERGSSKTSPLGINRLPEWYETYRDLPGFNNPKKSVYENQQAIFEARATFMQKQGLVSTHRQGMTQAMAEFSNAGGELATPPPAPPQKKPETRKATKKTARR